VQLYGSPRRVRTVRAAELEEDCGWQWINMLSMVPDVWGPKLHVPAGSVTRTRTGPNAISFTAPSHFAIVMLGPQPRRTVALNSDSRKTFSAAAGTLELVPAQSEL